MLKKIIKLVEFHVITEGEMFQAELPVPKAFSITAQAYKSFLDRTGIQSEINSPEKIADYAYSTHKDFASLGRIGSLIADFNDWKDWFLKSRKDKMKFWRKIIKIPKYTRNQYAILMCRYRITRRKYRTFKDYGSHMMFISGSKPGHLRRYYLVQHPCLRAW